ncbi:MAG: hypothetical protein R6V72_15915 [Cyclobacterium sp.]|uniref:hypothetical protein n=1 Tax=unclassified Cyclobacterium TaxID=2615055 RepID=UPI0013D72AFB|nr:hypothetical protein [Cyclobacterium sp. SYSU L10401]
MSFLRISVLVAMDLLLSAILFQIFFVEKLDILHYVPLFVLAVSADLPLLDLLFDNFLKHQKLV